nr:unnamed protein product [Naegleria fowleri]
MHVSKSLLGEPCARLDCKIKGRKVPIDLQHFSEEFQITCFMASDFSCSNHSLITSQLLNPNKSPHAHFPNEFIQFSTQLQRTKETSLMLCVPYKWWLGVSKFRRMHVHGACITSEEKFVGYLDLSNIPIEKLLEAHLHALVGP